MACDTGIRLAPFPLPNRGGQTSKQRRRDALQAARDLFAYYANKTENVLGGRSFQTVGVLFVFFRKMLQEK